jgi:carboxyl-terminal processing protease
MEIGALARSGISFAFPSCRTHPPVSARTQIMNQRYSTRPHRPFTLYLALLIAFVGGVWLERLGWLPGSVQQEPVELRTTFAPFWESWKLVAERYVDQDAVQPERMTRGAIGGMLASLGDTGHTSYLGPDELHLMREALSGRLEGIGARLTIRRGLPTIVSTVPGSPAAQAGLLSGDVLLQVGGKDMTNLPLSQIVERVRGPLNSVVHLQVRRDGVAEPIDVTVTRTKLQINDVTWQMLPGAEPVAHIVIHEFGEQAARQLRAALHEAGRHNARGLIVDVRGNPGGLKDGAIAVTSEFLASGAVFILRDQHGRETEVPVEPGGSATAIPLAILIDGGTASSAEIFAAAIQDHGRGKLVGTRTFGTGTVLRPFMLSDGGALLLAVAEWLTPNGRQIWHKGIKPDVEVSLATDVAIVQPDSDTPMTAAALNQSGDQQLLKALQILTEQIHEGI